MKEDAKSLASSFFLACFACKKSQSCKKPRNIPFILKNFESFKKNTCIFEAIHI